MSFAICACTDQARRYRELSRSINCPRTLALLDGMAVDLDAKATAIEATAATPNDIGLT